MPWMAPATRSNPVTPGGGMARSPCLPNDQSRCLTGRPRRARKGSKPQASRSWWHQPHRSEQRRPSSHRRRGAAAPPGADAASSCGVGRSARRDPSHACDPRPCEHKSTRARTRRDRRQIRRFERPCAADTRYYDDDVGGCDWFVDDERPSCGSQNRLPNGGYSNDGSGGHCNHH